MTASLGPLSEGQLQLFFLIQSHLLKPAADGLAQPVDAEVADAASALAATLETASRGVIFEHRAETVNGRRLAAELTVVLQEAGKGGGSRFEREAAAVLRAIANAASAAGEDHEIPGIPPSGRSRAEGGCAGGGPAPSPPSSCPDPAECGPRATWPV